MNKPFKIIAITFVAVATSLQSSEACTRATYIGPDNMVVTGRTMDWKEDIMSNIYVFPRGIERAGYNKGETVNWTSKYGSVIATGYDRRKKLFALMLPTCRTVQHRPSTWLSQTKPETLLFWNIWMEN